MKHRQFLQFITKNIYLCLIVFAVLFLGVGYAQMSGKTFNITGDATAVGQTGIFISNMAISDSYLADTANSRVVTYYQSMFSHRIILSNDLASYITYEVSVMNTSGMNYLYNGLQYIPEFYNNPEIICVSDLNPGDLLAAGDTLTFHITYKYDPSLTTITNTYVNSYVNIDWVEPPQTVLADIPINATANYTASSHTENSTWSPNANQNGFRANNRTYKLAKETYSGSSSATTLTQNALSWKVWSKDPDNNTVTLIATATTSQNVSFGGHTGWTNFVFLLDDICEMQYGGGVGATGRSMRLSDIEEKIIQAHGGVGYVDVYGNPIWSYQNVESIIGDYYTTSNPYGSVQRVGSVYLSDTFSSENDVDLTAINNESIYISAPIAYTDMRISRKDSINTYQTNYSISAENLQNLLPTETYNLIFGGTDYFLATRVTDVSNGNISYGMIKAGTGLNGVKIATGTEAGAIEGGTESAKVRPMLVLDMNQVNYRVEEDGSVSFS